MESTKSLDELELIATLLSDVQTSHRGVFSTRALRLTLKKLESRTRHEGISFLTKTLPRLGKALDKALCLVEPLNAVKCGFKPAQDSTVPKFLGELFQQVLTNDGWPLQAPCANCVRSIRLICYLFYKYELPYSHEQQSEVVKQFERTEDECRQFAEDHHGLRECLDNNTLGNPGCKACFGAYRATCTTAKKQGIIQEARKTLTRLFCNFDPMDVYPRHGPGAVATRQRFQEKYQWTNVSKDLTDVYPFDAFFCASQGHVCDSYESFDSITEKSLPARVVLVPKDSRGPRLISCEPVDYQWIQQGLGRAIVEHVEKHEMTCHNVFFTDQVPNQIGALYGSRNGKYATLDLKEASDRVTLELVRTLFPEHLYKCLVAARSCSTILPDGRELPLTKFAPMGSCLCFPVLALVVWVLLDSSMKDADARESIHVYGDDVIVPTAQAEDAISTLSMFGLKVNTDKSCTKGSFRESCGMDAFNGTNVTPVRLRTVWSSSRSPHVYSSWIAYANSFFDRQCYGTYNYIVDALVAVYRYIPDESVVHNTAPCLRKAPTPLCFFRSRTNTSLQKREYLVWVPTAQSRRYRMTGWERLLRFFAEVGNSRNSHSTTHWHESSRHLQDVDPFTSDLYTGRDNVKLLLRWR
jgi:hypothetical protein